jgi:uncharacterized protein
VVLLFPFCLVSALVLGIWFLAGIFILESVARRLKRRAGISPTAPAGPTIPRSKSLFTRKVAAGPRFRRTVFALAAATVLALVWAFCEPYWPEVTRVRITSPKIKGREPIRLVHISDLHCDPKVRLEARLPGIIAALKPDLVVFTGDAVNERAGIPVFKECMRRIAAICPVFGVQGNWEAWWFKEGEVLPGSGLRELDGEAVGLKIREDEISVAGVAVEHEDRAKEALARAPSNCFRIFLHHYPAMAASASRLGADLHCAGDTHGGQVRLPFVGDLVRIERHGVWMPTGLQRIGNMYLYVSRGLGMEGGAMPRIRFLCRPEVTLIEIGQNLERRSQ